MIQNPVVVVRSHVRVGEILAVADVSDVPSALTQTAIPRRSIPTNVVAAMQVNSEFFERLSGHSLTICKKCRYAVWPDQISHMKGLQHWATHRQANSKVEQVRSWSGLIENPNELQVPVHVERAFSQLPLREDGLLCRLDPAHCHYVCRVFKGTKMMKKH